MVVGTPDLPLSPLFANHIVGDMSMQEAVNAPRFHHQWLLTKSPLSQTLLTRTVGKSKSKRIQN
jgi:gamma-glutamyltranspeptidase